MEQRLCSTGVRALANDRKPVLIVGGAQGIGREVAERFLKEGHRVAVSDIDDQGLSRLKKQHPQLLTFQADVSSWESVQQLMSAAERELGGIHHLVYSAGMTKSLPFLEVDFSLWKKTLAVNLYGLFYCIKALAPYLCERQEGSIVIIGSGSAITGSGGGIQYYTSKAGAFGLMRSLVKELGSYHVRINVIAPRVIESQMLDTLYPTEEEKRQLQALIPIGRLGQPEDIAGLTLFLTNDEGSYLHGQIILLDGGRTYQPKYTEEKKAES
ncbi:SDR family NAD(P)-dependent oxidoreductase [Bacillus stratosphericus]|uniref:SDR family NAD(P)-dependent oxidoreductase n=1 Tax=Bacillus stratosphericus TaxID=293386 RepID=UPI001CFAF17C|nr:SDR family oxidoreductase [Bacillus stratosphericus]